MTPASKKRNAGKIPLDQQVFVDLVKTESQKMAELAALLKKYDLSEPQYNVLRILRGSGSEGLPCRQIAGRMLTRLPDITRLVDRLETGGSAKRIRSEQDRRIIRVRITAKGLRLLARLDAPVADLHRLQFSHMSRTDLRRLRDLLSRARLQGEG
jgi:DNA-binding MarR family transcriptional regulator